MIARVVVGLLASGAGVLLIVGLHHFKVRRSRRLDLPTQLRKDGRI